MTLLAASLASPVTSALCLALMLGMAALFAELLVALSERMPAGDPFALAVGLAVSFLAVEDVTTAQLAAVGVDPAWESAPAPSAWLLGLPVGAFAALAACALALAACELARILAWRRSHVTPTSVKEALDLLPQGVCFARADGTPVLVNRCLERVARALTGVPLADVDEFWDAARAAAVASGDARALTLWTEDGRAWLLRRTEVTVGGMAYTQVTAADVTEQHLLTRELGRRGAELRMAQESLRAYAERMPQVVAAEELLDAKVAVHDELGQLLLTAAYALDHPGAYDEHALLSSWEATIGRLLAAGEDQTDGALQERADAADELVAEAAHLGVEVRVEGEPPVEGVAGDLFVRALRECVTNSAKHAGGAPVTVRVGGGEASFSCAAVTKTDGVRETGGLRTLRQQVEAAGGTMRVDGTPAFTVTLRLP